MGLLALEADTQYSLLKIMKLDRLGPCCHGRARASIEVRQNLGFDCSTFCAILYASGCAPEPVHKT